MACVSCLPKSMHLIGVAGWWFLFSTLRMLSIEKGVNVLGVFSLEQSASISQSLPVDLALLNILLMTVRGGRFSFVHNPSATSFSLTSQEKIPGAVRRYSSILFFTSQLTSLEVFLCARPGSKDPVSLYLESSLLMQPCDTLSCLLISHGRMPRSAISIICWRTEFGSGLPFTNTPPSWFNFPWPGMKRVHSAPFSTGHTVLSLTNALLLLVNAPRTISTVFLLRKYISQWNWA